MSTRKIDRDHYGDNELPPECDGLEVTVRGEAWGDLVAALSLIRTKPNSNKTSPFHCEHDTLYVMAEPSDFVPQEIAQLREWGFNVDHDLENFNSFRYGNA